METEKLFVMPDAVHVFKNVAGSLMSGHRFYLDQKTVDAYKLPSSEISLVPITQVFELDKGDVLKLCPRLKANVISPNHFEKMNTSLSVALLSHDVAAAILYQISAKNIEAKHQTTAWFLMLMQKWFNANANPKEHDAAITFFHTFMEIVTNLKTNDNVWKPFQAGLLLSTQAALDLQHTGCPRTGSPEKTGMCRQQKRLQIDLNKFSASSYYRVIKFLISPIPEARPQVLLKNPIGC
jgi:hypothetical protein